MIKLELKEKINVSMFKDDIKASIQNFYERSRSKVKEVKEKVIIGIYNSKLKRHDRSNITDPSILPSSNHTDLDVPMNSLKTEVSYEKTPTVEELACNNCGVIISINNQNFCDLCGQEI